MKNVNFSGGPANYLLFRQLQDRQRLQKQLQSANHIQKYSVNTAQPDLLSLRKTNNVNFQGNIPSKQEKEVEKIEEEFQRLLLDRNVSENTRKEALKKYEQAKKEAGKAKAIKDTVNWLLTGAGASAALITIVEPTTASKIGALAAFIGSPISTLIANSFHKDSDGKTFWDRGPDPDDLYPPPVPW